MSYKATIDKVRCYAMGSAVNYEKGQVNSEYNIVNLTRRVTDRSFLSKDKRQASADDPQPTALVNISSGGDTIRYNPAVYTIYGYHVEIESDYIITDLTLDQSQIYNIYIGLVFLVEDKLLAANQTTSDVLDGVVFDILPEGTLPEYSHYLLVGSVAYAGGEGGWKFTPNPGILVKFTFDEIGDDDGYSIYDIFAKRYQTKIYGSLSIRSASDFSEVPRYADEDEGAGYWINYNSTYTNPTIISSEGSLLGELTPNNITITNAVISNELSNSDKSTRITSSGIISSKGSIDNLESNNSEIENLKAYNITAKHDPFSSNYSGLQGPATISGFRVWNAVYNDLAEFYKKDPNCPELEEGDLIKVSSDDTYTKFESDDDPYLVIGIYSPNYGFILGGNPNESNLSNQMDKYIPVALSGRVKVKITTDKRCKVHRGDLLVPAPNEGGVRSVNPHDKLKRKYLGCIIGKALEDGNSGDVILAQVMRA